MEMMGGRLTRLKNCTESFVNNGSFFGFQQGWCFDGDFPGMYALGYMVNYLGFNPVTTIPVLFTAFVFLTFTTVLLALITIQDLRSKLLFCYIAALILLEVFLSRLFVLLEWSHGFFLVVFIGSSIVLIESSRFAELVDKKLATMLVVVFGSFGLTLAFLSRPNDAFLFLIVLTVTSIVKNYLRYLLVLCFISFIQVILVLSFSNFMIFESVPDVSTSSHPFWHSLLAGVGWMGILTELPYSDDTAKTLTSELTGYVYPGFYSHEYEEMAKKAYFLIFFSDPSSTLKAYVLKSMYCVLQILVFAVVPTIIFLKATLENLMHVKMTSICLCMFGFLLAIVPGVLIWPSRSYIPVAVGLFGVFFPLVLNCVVHGKFIMPEKKT